MPDGQTSSDLPPNRTPKRLRVAGLCVLVLGLAIGGVVYGLGKRNADTNDDLSMEGFDRAEQRQMGQLYGKSGQLLDELEESLKQPGTQAGIIIGSAVVVSIGCFYFARLISESER